MKILVTFLLLFGFGTFNVEARKIFRNNREVYIQNSLNKSFIASIKTTSNRGITYVFEEHSKVPKYAINKFIGRETFLLKNNDYLLDYNLHYENNLTTAKLHLYFQGTLVDSASWIRNDQFQHAYIDTLSHEIVNYDNHFFTVDTVSNRLIAVENVRYEMTPIDLINEPILQMITPSFLVNGVRFEDWLKQEFRIKEAFYFSMKFTLENGEIVYMDNMFSTMNKRRKNKHFHDKLFKKLRKQTITPLEGEINLPVWSYHITMDFEPE